MESARLTHSSFPMAILWDVLLSDSTLKFADLVGADLRGSELDNVDFTGAQLAGANLSDTFLAGANFSDANLKDTVLFNVRWLTCEQIQKARNWQEAYRDERHACGAEIPIFNPNKVLAYFEDKPD